jgi:hypothetical protein
MTTREAVVQAMIELGVPRPKAEEIGRTAALDSERCAVESKEELAPREARKLIEAIKQRIIGLARDPVEREKFMHDYNARLSQLRITN